nr:hypothetical protein [Tanacetum cinerariifolium]
MGYEHLNTISKTQSDEVLKSSTKNLLPIPSEYEVTSNDESGRDVPDKDESSPVFTTFSNHIFDYNDDFTSSNDESLSDEDVPTEDFKVYSNPLFDDDEINSDKLDPHYFNAESEFVESLSNRDTLFDSSLKFDYLEEFLALMPTSIADEEHIRREHEEYISLIEKLFAINLVPLPLENFHANTIIETLPTYTIPVEDGDSQREEINIFTSTDDLLPPGIESDDYDSEEDIRFLEELLIDDSIPLPKNESSNFDHHDDPLFPRPPPKPPDVEFFFDLEPNSGEVISAVINSSDELNNDECFDLQAETVVNNHNHNVNYFRLTCTGKSHIEVVEAGIGFVKVCVGCVSKWEMIRCNGGAGGLDGEEKRELFLGEDTTRQYPTWVSTWLMLTRVYGRVSGFDIGVGEFTLSSLDVLQGFSFFLQMGLTLISATLNGLDMGLLGDVIGENDCDDDG